MGRWACNTCGHRLGLLMRNEIAKALEFLGLEDEVVRLFAHLEVLDVSAGLNRVEAYFANALNGELSNEGSMAGHQALLFKTPRYGQWRSCRPSWICWLRPRAPRFAWRSKAARW